MKLQSALSTLCALSVLSAGSALGFEKGSQLPRPDLENGLVRAERFSLRPVMIGEDTRALVFFYSASWCTPCKQVAAQLEKTYPDFKKQAPGLEFVTYSLDFSPRARADYLRETHYPWPAIGPAIIEKAPWLKKLENGTPQFQAFAVGTDSLTALTPPGPPEEVLVDALRHLARLETTLDSD